MAIQTRQGQYGDFDPAKMMPGEWACVRKDDPNASDGRAVYMCFEAGVVKRMATYDDMTDNIKEAFKDSAEELANQFTDKITEAITNANNAADELKALEESVATAEQERILAEEKRKTDTEEAITNANNAAKNANEAAKKANDAADGLKVEGSLETFPKPGLAGVLYIDTESDAVYLWDEETQTYKSLGGGSASNIVFASYGEFPLSGEENVLYVDTDKTEELSLYRWNGSAYIPASTGGSQVETVDPMLATEEGFAADALKTKQAIEAVNSKNGTVLWENPDPTAEFIAQSVSVDSSDYSFLEYIYLGINGYNSMKIPKEFDAELITLYSSGGFAIYSRLANYISDTEISFGDCFYSSISPTGAIGAMGIITNIRCVPFMIVGHTRL